LRGVELSVPINKNGASPVAPAIPDSLQSAAFSNRRDLDHYDPR
jgi:hypothetical protein